MEIHACHTGLEMKNMLEIKKGLEIVGKKRTAWPKKSRRGERRCRETRKKSLTSLLEMAKENGVGWSKEKVLTKVEETETGERRMGEDEGFGSKTGSR